MCVFECLHKETFWRVRALDNLNKVLTGMKSLYYLILWRNVAFCNSVQRPMSYKSKRPANNDFIYRGKSFSNFIDVLRPTLCVFCGLVSRNYISKSVKFFSPDIRREYLNKNISEVVNTVKTLVRSK